MNALRILPLGALILTALAHPAAAAPAGPAAPAGAVIASQESNWPGVTADVTEFRRKGNTLTAKVRLRNTGTAAARPDIVYKQAYAMDAEAGKKYLVLQDEKGAYIAAVRQGWDDRWNGDLAAGQSFLLWMKFPAPPPAVKSLTLLVPGIPPFEDLPIEDR